MNDVENFTGTKKDKQYTFLDEMLTRNLIKLDNIEAEGKENIRNARKEAIKCIQKCINVLEAKAEINDDQITDVNAENGEMEKEDETVENGGIEMNEPSKEEAKTEGISEQPPQQELQPHKEADTKAKNGGNTATKKQSKATDKNSSNDDTAREEHKADVKSGDTEKIITGAEGMQVDGDDKAHFMDVDGASQS